VYKCFVIPNHQCRGSRQYTQCATSFLSLLRGREVYEEVFTFKRSFIGATHSRLSERRHENEELGGPPNSSLISRARRPRPRGHLVLVRHASRLPRSATHASATCPVPRVSRTGAPCPTDPGDGTRGRGHSRLGAIGPAKSYSLTRHVSITTHTRYSYQYYQHIVHTCYPISSGLSCRISGFGLWGFGREVLG